MAVTYTVADTCHLLNAPIPASQPACRSSESFSSHRNRPTGFQKPSIDETPKYIYMYVQCMRRYMRTAFDIHTTERERLNAGLNKTKRTTERRGESRRIGLPPSICPISTTYTVDKKEYYLYRSCPGLIRILLPVWTADYEVHIHILVLPSPHICCNCQVFVFYLWSSFSFILCTAAALLLGIPTLSPGTLQLAAAITTDSLRGTLLEVMAVCILYWQ